jgi:hypothetical protein
LRWATAKPCPGAELDAAVDAFARTMCPGAQVDLSDKHACGLRSCANYLIFCANAR